MLAGQTGTDVGTGLTQGQPYDPDSSNPRHDGPLNCGLPTRALTLEITITGSLYRDKDYMTVKRRERMRGKDEEE